MPKYVPNGKCRRSMRYAENGQVLESAEALLSHLLECLERKEELPKGFFGSTIIELYKFISELQGLKPDKRKSSSLSAESATALEKWIMGQAITDDGNKYESP